MSEQISESHPPVSTQKESGAGAVLRAAREAQGLHIAMLAVSLKVPVKKLEALEADRYELFPDTVFVRALASSVCRSLKIDAAPVLASLPRSNAPKIKTDESGLNTIFDDKSSHYSRFLLQQLKRPLGMAVVLLLVSILTIVFFPKDTSFESALVIPVFDAAPAMPEVKAPPVEAEVVRQSGASSPMLSAVAAFSVADTGTTSVPGNATNQVKVASESASAPASSSPMLSETTGNNPTVLALHAHGTSWVEVVDAKGVLLLRKTLVDGDVAPVSGALPLTVVLGRSDLVSAVVRGQLLDTTTMSSNNVARFEVK